MSVKVIIFDFDGTLADTFDAIVQIANRLAGELGYKPTTPEELPKIRDLSSREIVRRSGVSLFKIPFIIKRVKEDLRKQIQQLTPISGIKEALLTLTDEGHQLGILTSNSEENVRLFLKNHEMLDLFSFIYSESTLFSKHRIIHKFIKQNRFNSRDIIYVGDETRDIEACKKIPIKIIAVSWGFNSRKALGAQRPDFLIDHPVELIQVMEYLQRSVSH